ELLPELADPASRLLLEMGHVLLALPGGHPAQRRCVGHVRNRYGRRGEIRNVEEAKKRVRRRLRVCRAVRREDDAEPLARTRLSAPRIALSRHQHARRHMLEHRERDAAAIEQRRIAAPLRTYSYEIVPALDRTLGH